MDAVMFFKEWKRMCRSSKKCLSCSIGESAGVPTVCSNVVKEEPEKYVAMVEKWSAEHPMKTRQSEFLKMFPNAYIRNGVIRICPRKIDQNSITSEECEECEELACSECQKKYWLAEVE